MSDETTAPGDAAGEEEQQPRPHPQDPAEGADKGTGTPEPRVHPQDPAEGADD